MPKRNQRSGDPDGDAKAIAQLQTKRRPGNVRHRRGEAEARARRIQALQLRIAGLTYEDIGRRMDITAHQVGILISRALYNGERAPNVRELRELENNRLDRLQAAVWTQALRGDLQAVDRVLRIIERRSKLNGLDAPTSVNVSVGVRAEMETALGELQQLIMPQPDAETVDAEIVDDEETP